MEYNGFPLNSGHEARSILFPFIGYKNDLIKNIHYWGDDSLTFLHEGGFTS